MEIINLAAEFKQKLENIDEGINGIIYGLY